MSTISTPVAHFVTLSGHRPNDVLDVVRARARAGSRADGHRLALVVEGGSMRGVYTAGSLVALHIMGLWNLFDNAYGTSAGAANAAHFLSGLGHLKADSYYRVLADRRFYNPYRLRKIVDVDFFVDEVLTKLRPMEVDRVMHSPTPLWVSVGDFVTARIMSFHAQAGRFPLLQLLKAAAAMPIVYNKLIDLGDVRGFDAGSVSPFALDEAVAHQNTHILVLLAKPEGFVSSPLTWWERSLLKYRFARGNSRIMEMYKRADGNCNRLRDLAHGRAIPTGATSIATIAPVSEIVGRTTQNRNVLRAELLNAARGTLRLFGQTEDPLDELAGAGTL
jgi:predicted patatin/cPLA2 family phospholipase